MRFHKLEESIANGIALVGLFKRDEIPVQREYVGALLRVSQKFFCGDLRSFPHMKDYVNYPQLPFDVVAFEYIGDTTGYFCVAVAKWLDEPHPLFLFFMRDPDRCLFLGAAKLKREEAEVECVLAQDCVTAEEKKDAMNILYTHMKGIGDFLSVLNCVNVKTEEVPAPVKLNKKRYKNRKLPIYSYKTLVLTSRSERLIRGVGSHESPRIHLRRGHIKHRKTGDFWWQPHVVGDRTRGVVMKDYRADKLVEASS